MLVAPSLVKPGARRSKAGLRAGTCHPRPRAAAAEPGQGEGRGQLGLQQRICPTWAARLLHLEFGLPCRPQIRCPTRRSDPLTVATDASSSESLPKSAHFMRPALATCEAHGDAASSVDMETDPCPCSGMAFNFSAQVCASPASGGAPASGPGSAQAGSAATRHPSDRVSAASSLLSLSFFSWGTRWGSALLGAARRSAGRPLGVGSEDRGTCSRHRAPIPQTRPVGASGQRSPQWHGRDLHPSGSDPHNVRSGNACMSRRIARSVEAGGRPVASLARSLGAGGSSRTRQHIGRRPISGARSPSSGRSGMPLAAPATPADFRWRSPSEGVKR